MPGWFRPRRVGKGSAPKSEAQKKIGQAGRRIAQECTGFKGAEFQACRSKVLEEFFPRKETKAEWEK